MTIPSGEIYLLRNVPLTASYEHTIDFKDKNEQFNYFIGFRKYTLDKYTYIRKEREYLSFGMPIADVDDINYMLFRPADGERLYFAFVGNKRFINKELTEITFEIDVMQTYMFDYKFNASYIRQAHVDRWSADHKPIYSKTNEGLDYGTEYAVESAFKIEQNQNIHWFLVSMTYNAEIIDSENSETNFADFFPAPSPYLTLMVPLVINKQYKNYPIAFNTDSWGMLIKQFPDLMEFMLKSAIGNDIRSISLLPYNPFVRESTGFGSGYLYVEPIDVTNFGYLNFKGDTTGTDNTPYLLLKNSNDSVFRELKTLAIADWDIGLENTLPTAKQWEEIKQNPYTTKRDKRFESKLLCAPYRYNMLSDWRTNPVILKNEYMTPDKIELQYSFAFSINAPFRYWVKDYKKDLEGRNACLSQPLSPEMPIISDAYYTYMLQNKNTIQTNITNGVINAGMGVLSGAVSGGVAGAVMAGVGGAVSVATNIRSENAKQADLKAVPDSIINTNDSSFNIIDNNNYVTFYRMRICCENEEILAEIFNMTGYKVNRVEVPNLRSRTRFNYIQTLGANITGAFSQTDILKIKSIFDNGITIWHYNNVDFRPLDYTLENVERNLI